MTIKQVENFFKPHAEAFWVAILKRLEDDFKIYQNSDSYENETFADTLDEYFWSMGCNYLDYASDIVDDYFYSVVDKKEYDELKEAFAKIDNNYIDLRSYLFETYILPKIKAIIIGETK
jgi:hypothetical protein